MGRKVADNSKFFRRHISMVLMKLPDDATTLPPPLFEDEALEEDGESPMTTEKGTDTKTGT